MSYKKKIFVATFILLNSISFSYLAYAEAVLLNADIAYGEYLAGECVTCHGASNSDKGIPNIIGLDAVGIAYSLHSYRKKELENKVMQLVAGRLDDEQIASLAIYFSSLASN